MEDQETVFMIRQEHNVLRSTEVETYKDSNSKDIQEIVICILHT